MGLKKRSKVSAEFSMSSLTDIIFLLLIFFMLTSTLVAPNALNLKLPGSSSSRVVSTERIDKVYISRDGGYYLNGRQYNLSNLENQLVKKVRARSRKLDMTIEVQEGTPTENVVLIMEMAMRHGINGILATS